MEAWYDSCPSLDGQSCCWYESTIPRYTTISCRETAGTTAVEVQDFFMRLSDVFKLLKLSILKFIALPHDLSMSSNCGTKKGKAQRLCNLPNHVVTLYSRTMLSTRTSPIPTSASPETIGCYDCLAALQGSETISRRLQSQPEETCIWARIVFRGIETIISLNWTCTLCPDACVFYTFSESTIEYLIMTPSRKRRCRSEDQRTFSFKVRFKLNVFEKVWRRSPTMRAAEVEEVYSLGRSELRVQHYQDLSETQLDCRLTTKYLTSIYEFHKRTQNWHWGKH